MKIVLINGQNHKGSTYRIGRMLAEKLGKPGEIKEFFLPRDMPKFCCGCTRCFMENERLCPHSSYLRPITEAMDSADLLIFTTPVYVYHATGSMKALLDHYGYRWMVHRPEMGMFHKQGVCIATAAGAGVRSACKDIKDSLFFWGVAKIYTYGTAIAATSWESVTERKRREIARNVEQMARQIRKHAGATRASLKTKGFFYLMRFLMKRGWNEVDYNYWKEQGWDKKERPWNLRKWER